jgi:hypothetical protein
MQDRIAGPALLGFGGLSLLDILQRPDVRAYYDKLRSVAWRVAVSVEKLAQPTPDRRASFGNITRFTFTGFSGGKWSGPPLKQEAVLTVDRANRLGVADDPDYVYEVSFVRF